MEIQGEPEDSKSEFGKNEEKSIISLILDEPEYASTILPYLTEEHFDVFECSYVFKIIKYHWDKHNIIISRKMLIDTANDVLTADDPHKEIIGIIERESDPREIPIVREKITDWAKKKAFAKLFSQESIDAHQRGDYTLVESIVEEARKITGFQTEFFFFFDQCDKLFEPENEQHLSTGFHRLDTYINMGGPIKGDCFCWLAPTGVGKCHTLESKIIIEDLSRIFELEVESNGKIQVFKLAGFREVQTTRGKIRVCDLIETDDIIEIPTWEDTGDLYL